jgi:hypothetical protein
MGCAACGRRTKPGRKYCGCKWRSPRDAATPLDKLRSLEAELWSDMQKDSLIKVIKTICDELGEDLKEYIRSGGRA